MNKPYVIDALENLGRYAQGENLSRAIEFLLEADLKSLPPGKIEVDGDRVWINVIDADLVSLSERKPEVHHAYHDIQIPLSDEETYGLAAFEPSAAGSFDEKKDIGFYDQLVDPVTVKPGEFAIFYAGVCAHAPACSLTGPRRIRKIVVKVRA